MERKIMIMITGLAALAFLFGCAGVPEVKAPAPVVEKPVTYELGGLYLTTDANQMSGVARDNVKLGVGETVVIYARGQNASDGKWFELPADVVVTWKADKELAVTPATGNVVTVKVVKPISVSAYVTATTTKKTGEKIEANFTVMPKK